MVCLTLFWIGFIFYWEITRADKSFTQCQDFNRANLPCEELHAWKEEKIIFHNIKKILLKWFFYSKEEIEPELLNWLNLPRIKKCLHFFTGQERIWNSIKTSLNIFFSEEKKHQASCHLSRSDQLRVLMALENLLALLTLKNIKWPHMKWNICTLCNTHTLEISNYSIFWWKEKKYKKIKHGIWQMSIILQPIFWLWSVCLSYIFFYKHKRYHKYICGQKL